MNGSTTIESRAAWPAGEIRGDGRESVRAENHHAPPAITIMSAAIPAASGASPNRLFGGAGAVGVTGSAGFGLRRDPHLQRISANLPVDVLELGRSEIGNLHLEPAAHLPISVLRKANRAGLGDALEPRGDIDAVAHQIAVALLDDVSDMDADSVLDAPVLRHAGVALDEAVLNLDRAADGVHDAAKLDDASIAGALDDAAVMGGDGGVDEVAAQPPQARKGPILVGARQPAVADDVRNQDRRELARFGHCVLRPQTNSTILTFVRRNSAEIGMVQRY